MTSPRAIDPWLAEHSEEMRAVRRHLHAHPELSGQEHVTTDYLFERLTAAGLEPRILSSGTGLICDIGEPIGGRVALRADIDALGMQDEKNVPYRSQVQGVAHACGHDVHTTIMLAAALHFAHRDGGPPIGLRMIFQPAEERVPGGALNVLADDGLAGVDAVFGFHCDPKLAVGRVGLCDGPMTSAADMMRVVLTGPGGHTARPEQTVDLVSLTARVIIELPTRIVSQLPEPLPVKLVFGSVHAGDAANVIPARSELRASIRTPVLELWEDLEDHTRLALEAILQDTGAEFELEYINGVPPVVNDPGMVDVARRAAVTELGDNAVTEAVQSWGGDDYAWYSRERAAAYIRLGVHDPDSPSPPLDLHAGHFDVDERSIDVGIRMAVAIVDTLADGQG